MNRINIDEPKYNQNNFYGRFRHFLKITDWRLLAKTDKDLDDAQNLLHLYKEQREPPGTTEEQVWAAKYLYDSAFHPDTGEKQFILGRMCCQVPGGMFVTGTMLSFYKTNLAVVFWQFMNQSFNALVNYTNRNANSPLTTNQMAVAYVTATSTALVSALGFKKLLSTRASPLFQRFVPFLAVAMANVANIPLMRQNELIDGITVCDNNGNEVAKSKLAASKGISQVVLSRIIMAAPAMTLLPVIMMRVERRPFFRHPLVNVVTQTLGVGLFLCFMTPAACAIYKQKCSISTSDVKRFEPDVYSQLEKKYGEQEMPEYLYFNKGL